MLTASRGLGTYLPGPGDFPRLHGRNAATWDKNGLTSSERFDYEYQEQEVREFIQPVRRLAEQAQGVHVVFNNNLRDQGIRGARLFARRATVSDFDEFKSYYALAERFIGTED